MKGKNNNMNFIDSFAKCIALTIRRNDPNARSEAVLTYALIIVINTLLTIFIVLFVSILTHHFINACIAMFSFMLLRYFSGGAHLNSSLSCTLLSSGLLLAIVHIEVNFWYTGFILNSLALLIVLLKAPSGIEKVRKFKPGFIPLLKYISALIVISNYLIHSPLLSTVFFIQAVTLFKIVDKTIKLIERSSEK